MSLMMYIYMLIYIYIYAGVEGSLALQRLRRLFSDPSQRTQECQA